MPDDEAVEIVLVAGDVAGGDPAGLLSILGEEQPRAGSEWPLRNRGGRPTFLSPAGQAAPLAPQFETTFLVVRSSLAPRSATSDERPTSWSSPRP